MQTPAITRISLVGLGMVCAGIVWTAVFFENADGTAFNPLRNFVSELGSEKASPMAFVFNGGLIFGGLLLCPLIHALTLRLDGGLRRLAQAAGGCVLIGALGVGLISIDHLKPHLAGALLFFWGWLATALIFTCGLWRKYSFRHAPVLLLAGVLSITFSAAFLAVLTHALAGLLNGAFAVPQDFRRPAVWDIAVLEWCVVASCVLWILAAIVHLRGQRADRS